MLSEIRPTQGDITPSMLSFNLCWVSFNICRIFEEIWLFYNNWVANQVIYLSVTAFYVPAYERLTSRRHLYRPHNIFTGVCLSIGGVWQTFPGRHPLGRHPPRQTPPGRPPPGRHPVSRHTQADTPKEMATANEASGTHPTGMYSCSILSLMSMFNFRDAIKF